MRYCIFCSKRTAVEVCKNCYNQIRNSEIPEYLKDDTLPFEAFDELVKVVNNWDLTGIDHQEENEIQFTFSNQEMIYLRSDNQIMTNSLRLFKLLADMDYKVLPKFDNDSIYWLIFDAVEATHLAIKSYDKDQVYVDYQDKYRKSFVKCNLSWPVQVVIDHPDSGQLKRLIQKAVNIQDLKFVQVVH